MSEYFQPLITQLDANTALNANNASTQRLLAAKNHSSGLIESENIRLKAELDAARRALREADEITKEWQAAMFAWKNLAQALRDEIKACPNHEAHKFGKNDTARAERMTQVENEERVKRGIQPRG